MKKIISAIGLFIALSSPAASFADTNTYQVAAKDIHSGYIVQKIWLNYYTMPQVSVADVSFSTDAKLPKDAKASDPAKFDVVIGVDRKRPFAIVRIPAYAAGAVAGQVSQVTGYTLTVTQAPASSSSYRTTGTTDVTTSILSTGTWYKIAVPQTGLYKIDAAFITSMGLTPANVNPGNIRIFGNGGNMLSENNAIARPSDLLENAIQVNDNGDASFDNGESVIFYAVGPTGWQKDSANQRFTHLKNLYSDTAYYFITFDHGAGLHAVTQSAPGTANVSVSSFNYYDVHDSDMVNPAGIGKLWLGEQFYPQLGNTTQTFGFDLGTTVSSVYTTISYGSSSETGGSNVSVALNGQAIGTMSGFYATPGSGDDKMALVNNSWTNICNSPTLNYTLTLNYSDGTTIGYLDYIEINARRPLTMSGTQMNFRDWQSTGSGNIAGYQLQGANSATKVWDVTNPQVPVIMTGSLSGSTYSFSQDAQRLHEFAAMNGGTLLVPKYISGVPNQNLHGTAQVDGIIITYPGFLDEANQLADYHRSHDNMKIVVATTDQVYNEFSSGGQDLSAIRDFTRMFYKRAGTDSTQLPKYLLLLGAASYDYKYRLPNNSNFVPVFESAASINDLASFTSDDFFGFLDDNEDIENGGIYNVMDIGIGRLPARSEADAKALVNKAMNYTSAATLGPWRISSTHVADNDDIAGLHEYDAESMAATVTSTTNNLYNEQKVYLDAIPTISTPAGDRCPNANASINDNVYKGTFLINYNGHGNPQVWATERILTQDDFNTWNNVNALPFMVTATCDFGQFDHPQFVSAAELLVLRTGGGAIAILTTTQAVYADYNHELNVQYLQAQFTRNANGQWNTFGEASRIGKNATYNISHQVDEISNFRKFSLLGDPMLTPDFPEHTVHLDSVTDGYTMERADTVKALGSYIINGSVRDNSGNLLNSFNGMLSVSFYDKPRLVDVITTYPGVFPFNVQDNIVYKGKVSVINGLFSFTFIAPKDINYYYGKGKISTYATNGVTDGAGADTTTAVGGFSDHPQYNSNPPIVRPYISDSLFLNGGITGANTSLFVSLFDETGINVSGTNVGHDLTAVLDGNVETPYILNDYYETAPNTYQRGYVSFPIAGLADGHHTIKVRAWDVNNNMGEGSVDFMVINGQAMVIENLGNYPNPFNNLTHFVFEHNHPDEALNVQIEIYNTAGALVKRIQQDFTPTGSRSADITWDGTDNSGTRLASGVYVYRLNITTDKGFKASAYQKLVIVR